MIDWLGYRNFCLVGFVICLVYFEFSIKAQDQALYLVTLKDKSNSKYSIAKPEKFLSQKAIERRKKNNAPVTEQDFPVSGVYLDSLKKAGAIIINTSRWFNSVTIALKPGTPISSIESSRFVSSVQKTRDGISEKSMKRRNKLESDVFEYNTGFDSSEYGKSYRQIEIENGQYLHNLGYKGEGITIAILDAGFLNVNNYKSLADVREDGRILSTKDFVYPTSDIYTAHYHGAWVMSAIASYAPGEIIGTAPGARFHLLRTEDSDTEYPVEEDNWIAGAEYADSVGADIINSSLGYSLFDNSIYDYAYADMDGETTRVSKAAKIAASKGILVVVSAGNSGDEPWYYITSPADAKDIIAVGALTSEKVKAGFSSFGPSADNRVKPEIMAMGQFILSEVSPDTFGIGSGTSFSAPIISGISACLMQAFPSAKSAEIRDAIIKSSVTYNLPDPSYGYGIPDYEEAYAILKVKYNASTKKATLYPNPFNNNVKFYTFFNSIESLKIECFNISGNKLFETHRSGDFINLTSEIGPLTQGYYFFKISSESTSVVIKGVKIAQQ